MMVTTAEIWLSMGFFSSHAFMYKYCMMFRDWMGWQIPSARSWSKGSFLLEGRYLIWQAGHIGYTPDLDGWTPW